MSPYVKLPNGTIVNITKEGYFTVNVDIELSTFLNNSPRSFLDVLSQRILGSDCLENISYSVIGHSGGNLITLSVTAGGEGLEDLEELLEADVPKTAFDVEVTRVGYGQRTVQVLARTTAEAEALADDDAGNHLYDEQYAEYRFSSRKL